MKRVLVEQPDAGKLHMAGLEAARAGQFGEAHEQFDQAQTRLAQEPETVNRLVQSARIERDRGFTYVREAAARRESAILELGRTTLNRSLDATAPFLSTLRYPLPLGADALGREARVHQTTKRSRREIFAEHGATLALLGRLATVNMVIQDISATEETPAAITNADEQQAYGLAHDLLRIGTNGYYRVNNAMNAARQEWLNGRVLHAGVWVARASAGLGWTVLRDSQNLLPTTRTFLKNLSHLRSYTAAKDSVLIKP